MVSFSVGVLRIIVVRDMYKALSIHKIRQNTKMPTFYETLYLVAFLLSLVLRPWNLLFPYRICCPTKFDSSRTAAILTPAIRRSIITTAYRNIFTMSQYISIMKLYLLPGFFIIL